MVFGAYLPSTQQKHLRGAQVPPQRAFSICPQGLATAHCSSRPGEKSYLSIFPADFCYFARNIFQSSPRDLGTLEICMWASASQAFLPNEHEIWAESLPKPRAEKDRRQPGECASSFTEIPSFYAVAEFR